MDASIREPQDLNAQIELVCDFTSLGSKIMENDGLQIFPTPVTMVTAKDQYGSVRLLMKITKNVTSLEIIAQFE